jgi:glycosyltransferase involved in cell wall biosynthesis
MLARGRKALSDRLRLLFIHDSASVCETLAHQAKVAGDEVTMVLPRRGLTTYKELGRCTTVARGGRPGVAAAYVEALLHGKYDVVIVSSRLGWVLGALAKSAMRRKLVVILHGSDIRRLGSIPWARREVFMKGLEGSDFVFYASPDTRPLVEGLGVPFAQLPYPVDTELFSPRGPAVNLTGNPAVFVPTRLDVDKGTKAIMDLISRATVAYSDSVFHVVGWPASEKVLRALQEKAPPGRVRTLGFIDRTSLPRYYRGSTILIGQMKLGFGSMTELEAMSCGLPAVFYDRYYGYGSSEGSSPAISLFFDSMVTDDAARTRKVEQGLDLIRRVHDSRIVYAEFRKKLALVAG